MADASDAAEFRVRVRANPVTRVPRVLLIAVLGAIFVAAEVTMLVAGLAALARSSVPEGVFFLGAGAVLLLPLVFLSRLCWSVAVDLSRPTYLTISPAGMALGRRTPSPAHSVGWGDIASVELGAPSAPGRFVVRTVPRPAGSAGRAREWFAASLTRMEVDPEVLRAAVTRHSGGAFPLTPTG